MTWTGFFTKDCATTYCVAVLGSSTVSAVRERLSFSMATYGILHFIGTMSFVNYLPYDIV